MHLLPLFCAIFLMHLQKSLHFFTEELASIPTPEGEGEAAGRRWVSQPPFFVGLNCPDSLLEVFGERRGKCVGLTAR